VCERRQHFRLTEGVFTAPDAELLYAAIALLAEPSSAERVLVTGVWECLHAARYTAVEGVGSPVVGPITRIRSLADSSRVCYNAGPGGS
jgi:hypothetical protein